MKIIEDCGIASPETGQLCTMGKGHVGPHKVGGPYHTVETFVIKCTDKPCEYHHNSALNSKTRERDKWLECIHCGHQIEQPLDGKQAVTGKETLGAPGARLEGFSDWEVKPTQLPQLSTYSTWRMQAAPLPWRIETETQEDRTISYIVDNIGNLVAGTRIYGTDARARANLWLLVYSVNLVYCLSPLLRYLQALVDELAKNNYAKCRRLMDYEGMSVQMSGLVYRMKLKLKTHAALLKVHLHKASPHEDKKA